MILYSFSKQKVKRARKFLDSFTFSTHHFRFLCAIYKILLESYVTCTKDSTFFRVQCPSTSCFFNKSRTMDIALYLGSPALHTSKINKQWLFHTIFLPIPLCGWCMEILTFSFFLIFSRSSCVREASLNSIKLLIPDVSSCLIIMRILKGYFGFCMPKNGSMLIPIYH